MSTRQRALSAQPKTLPHTFEDDDEEKEEDDDDDDGATADENDDDERAREDAVGERPGDAREPR